MWQCGGCAGGGCKDPGSVSSMQRRCCPPLTPRSSNPPLPSVSSAGTQQGRRNQWENLPPASARRHRLVQPGEGGIEGRQGAAPKNVANTGESGRFACARVAQCALLSLRGGKTVIGSCKMIRCWVTPPCDLEKTLLKEDVA